MVIFSSLYLIFHDIKLMAVIAAFINIANITVIIRVFLNGKMFSGAPLNLEGLLIQFMMISSYSFILLCVTKVSNDVHKNNLDMIREGQTKTESILEEVLQSAVVLRQDAENGSSLMEELDKSTNDSKTIFTEIAAGNVQNCKSVEKQAEMTANITDMINIVVKDANDAMHTTNLSSNGIVKGKKTISSLKEKSTEIAQIEYNSEYGTSRRVLVIIPVLFYLFALFNTRGDSSESNFLCYSKSKKKCMILSYSNYLIGIYILV